MQPCRCWSLFDLTALKVLSLGTALVFIIFLHLLSSTYYFISIYVVVKVSCMYISIIRRLLDEASWWPNFKRPSHPSVSWLEVTLNRLEFHRKETETQANIGEDQDLENDATNLAFEWIHGPIFFARVQPASLTHLCERPPPGSSCVLSTVTCRQVCNTLSHTA